MLIISPASRGLCHSNTAVVLLSLLTRRSRSSPSEDGLPFLKISDAPDRFTVEAEKLQTELQVRMMRLSKLTSIISISCISYNAFGGKTELRTWQFCKWDAPLCFLLLSKPRRETRRREDDKTALNCSQCWWNQTHVILWCQGGHRKPFSGHSWRKTCWSMIPWCSVFCEKKSKFLF